MSSALETETARAGDAAPGRLPARMRVLFITTPSRPGAWLTEALEADSASVVVLEEAQGAGDGAAQLRDENFDAVLASHDPPRLDALQLVEGLRAAGCEEPMIILGDAGATELAPVCYEVDADAYLCVAETTTRALLWTVARAIERHAMLAENRRLRQAHQTRMLREKDEAGHLLQQQRALVDDLEALCPDQRGPDESLDARPGAQLAGREAATRVDEKPLPKQLVEHYRQLLRAYVVMGSGNLADEMKVLGELLAAADVSPRQALALHLDVLGELVQGLGSRSARHVMTRGDLLALEVVVHLAEAYRRRYREEIHPLKQLPLPGFASAAPLSHDDI